VGTWSRKWCGAAALALLIAVSGIGGARADVVAVLDQDGEYLRTDVRMVRQGRIASVWLGSDSRIRRDRRNGLERVPLNESGAARADGAPSIANHPLTGLPWAIWAFNEDGDYELALSYFDGRDWSSPILLSAAPNGIDELEPKLLFTPDGRPLIVWWRMSEDGSEQSVWLRTRVAGDWLPPVRLSSTRREARRPSLLLDGEQLIVAFETERGIEIRTIPLDAPALGGHEPAGGHDGPDPPTYDDGTRPPECQLIGCYGD
jgi:hypothetical protein